MDWGDGDSNTYAAKIQKNPHALTEQEITALRERPLFWDEAPPATGPKTSQEDEGREETHDEAGDSSSEVDDTQKKSTSKSKAKTKGSKMMKAKGKHHGKTKKIKSKTHTYRADGLMEVNPNGPHPIYDVIRTSEKRWEEKLQRASKSLEEAVDEYKRRYHRMPPKNFEKW